MKLLPVGVPGRSEVGDLESLDAPGNMLLMKLAMANIAMLVYVDMQGDTSSKTLSKSAQVRRDALNVFLSAVVLVPNRGSRLSTKSELARRRKGTMKQDQPEVLVKSCVLGKDRVRDLVAALITGLAAFMRTML
jgi:hypothetical protein